MAESQIEALNWKIVEDNIIIICLIYFFALSGLFGNILSVYFFGFKERKNLNDILIAALTASDAVANVLAATEAKKLFNYMTFTDEIGCKIHYFLTHSIVKLTTLILLFIAFNRQRLLCHPFSWQLTPKGLALSILAAILYSLSSSFVQLMIAHVEEFDIVTTMEHGKLFEKLEQMNATTENMRANFSSNIIREKMTVYCNRTEMNTEGKDVAIDGNNTSTQKKLMPKNQTFDITNNCRKSVVAHVCTNIGTTDSNKTLFEIFNLSDAVVTITIVLLLIYLYGSIAKVVYDHWKKRKELQKEQRKKDLKFRTDIKITLMAVTFTVLTGLTFIPFLIVKSLQTPDLVNDHQIRLRMIAVSYMLNSAIDPYVLVAFIPNFRQFFKQIICCSKFVGGKKDTCQQEEM